MKCTKILALGECMANLDICSSLSATIQFSGDVYNALVYAKRWDPQLDTFFVSAVGHDKLSQLMLRDAQQNKIDCSLVLSMDEQNLGIYTISTDDKGQASFDYWRQNSAARRYLDLVKTSELSAVQAHSSEKSLVYFSGISLAIFRGSDREKFLMFLQKIKSQGAIVAFDPNYRPLLWENQADASSFTERCYAFADIILPGLDDHMGLFGHRSLQEMRDYFARYKGKEIVIKGNSEGMLAIDPSGSTHTLALTPARRQLDDTAAGDSFAGIYLASRCSGDNIDTALQHAANVAREVVMHKGAIVPEQHFEQFLYNMHAST